MAIDIEKILTISAEAYCGMEGRELSEYIPVGVHYYNKNQSTNVASTKTNLGWQAPLGTEVIVGYRASISIGNNQYRAMADGTALIPKEVYLAQKEGINEQYRSEQNGN